MRATVEGEGDVSEEAVRLGDREAGPVSEPGRRGVTSRLAGPFRYRERVCFHAASKQPAAHGRSTALVICRSKIASTPRRSLPRQPNKEETKRVTFSASGHTRPAL